MTQTFIAVLVLAAAIICAGVLAGGVYAGVQGGDTNVSGSFVINRFTGAVYYCQPSGCRSVRAP
jgi:hypothetical protein